MRTETIYAVDSAVREFESAVLAVQEDEIALERTAFYPGGGGQPHDVGTLGAGERTWQVVGMRKDGDLLWHRLEGAEPPAAGETVAGRVDWERRYRLMRTHTALHVLTAVALRDHGATVTGGNMEPGEGRLDFEIAGFTPAMAESMIARANEEAARDLPVRVYTLPRDEALQLSDLIRTKTNLVPPTVTHIRVVEIEGLDRQADGGTHVASTRQIGGIDVVKVESKGRANRRLRISLR